MWHEASGHVIEQGHKHITLLELAVNIQLITDLLSLGL